MKRISMTGLVVILTVISVFAMVTVKGSDKQEEPVFIEDEEDLGKPEGTGYMFDDYDKDINIPFEKQEDVKPEKEKESSQIDLERFRKLYEKNMVAIDGRSASDTSSKMSVKSYSTSNTAASAGKDIRSKSKTIISRVQNNISLEEKLYLVKVVSRLNLSEINDIRDAIMNGTTNAESIKLWTMLRNKLPQDEYIKLENIIAKYE